MAAVTGGIQIANIKKEKIPAMAKGARVNKPTVALVGEAGREIVLANSIVDDPQLGPIADDLARIQEGKKPRFLSPPAKANLQGIERGLSSRNQSTIVNNNNTVVNQYDTELMNKMTNEMSAMRKDVVNAVSSIKYLKTYITDKQLTDRDKEIELLNRYSKF